MNNLEKFFEEVYKESHFKEISSAQFADILRKYVFNRMPVDNENAGLGAMDKMVKQIHNKHYQRNDELGKKKDSFGGVENVAKVIKTPDTHLQLNNGDYCEKEAFRNQFSQETWDELPEQFRARDTPNILCNRYLTGYRDDGWIDSKIDTLDDKIR